VLLFVGSTLTPVRRGDSGPSAFVSIMVGRPNLSRFFCFAVGMTPSMVHVTNLTHPGSEATTYRLKHQLMTAGMVHVNQSDTRV
jgi:hypothetical protein